MMTRRLKKIAIVGGGVSGLLSLRHILRYPHLRPTLFEGTNDIGGVWVYDGKQNRYRYENIDHQKTPLSVYRNLISNQSKQIMEFCDFKHENTSLPTFVHHEYVLDYLKRFSNNYQLESYIRLNHRVTNILPVFCPTNDFLHWKVEVAHKDREPVAHIFDAVAVCSGHFTTPNIPQLPGLQYFRGEILHSRYYRRPEDFYDKTVLVIGAGISGLDIALDISRFSTKNIYVSEVSHFSADGHSVTLADGKTISVDTVIFATGFLFDYPFLDKNCGITVNDNRVTHLFKHIVNINCPSMFFVGIPNWTPQFQLLYFQAVYISKVLANEISLPPADEMLLDESHDFKLKTDQGWPPRKAHNMFGISFKYLDYLADTSCIDRMPRYLRNIYNHVLKTRIQDVMNFRNVTFRREDFE